MWLANDHQSIGAVGPASRPLSGSPDLHHNVDQNSHVPSVRMDLPGSHLQELQPDLHRVDDQTEDMLAVEQSCEYKVLFQRPTFEMDTSTYMLVLLHRIRTGSVGSFNP